MNSVRSAMMREALVLVLVMLTTVAGRPFKAGEGWPACGNRACQENEIEVSYCPPQSREKKLD